MVLPGKYGRSVRALIAVLTHVSFVLGCYKGTDHRTTLLNNGVPTATRRGYVSAATTTSSQAAPSAHADDDRCRRRRAAQ